MMGLPALRHEPVRQARKPHLRLVKSGKARTGGSCHPRRRSVSNAASFQLYVFVATVIIVVALAGVARVWLTVQAAEASVDAARLRKEIKVARYQGDMLEIRQSALAAPSRIQAIAGSAMGMEPVDGISYLDLTAEAKPSSGGRTVDSRRADAGGMKRVLASAMNLAAGEAQVMLVGDVGLASAK